jgi:hypothetical protein
MLSQMRGVPLGQKSLYGPTAATELYGRVAVCTGQNDPIVGETLFFETEAVPEGEAGAEVSVLRTVRPDFSA